MNGSIVRRLDKLEAALLPSDGDGLAALTWDELEVRVMDLSRKVAADPCHDQAVREEAAARVERIEDGIRYQASALRRPGYAAHLACVSRGRDGYVPAVCAMEAGHGAFCSSGMMEFGGLDRPRIMERRAALRARPDIALLIEEGSRA